MGISGLLPLLKSIHVQKHLSEFSGQTLAVDGYVWLHRGAYACATELATGRSTRKYVDYAMQRVRLLRHYGIQPYLVFDGGPLPAKRGTENERRERREESLMRGNALAAQGRHAQARELYCKCLDVTPQMAYQFIKALRAENVPYIVAPYEADAQLAYLERTGVVDGIITEDSDLLVFGCKNVLFKLDSVSATLTSISRKDFGSVNDASGGLSLRGWTDVEFRSMAILSGCDYLPSIPGVGLKTAWMLLRKHRTAENVIRALKLEGKKEVPRGYLESFKLAEKVFLHQRVYDPVQEKLVYLHPIPEGEVWKAEQEAYFGEDIEPTLAKKVAQGDVDPISLLAMVDINPSFVPCTVKPLPLTSTDLNRSAKDKGKLPAKLKTENILNFLTPKAKGGVESKSTLQHRSTTPKIIAGRASGKRSLTDVMREDMTAKRKRQSDAEAEAENLISMQSRFFAPDTPVAGPSRQGSRQFPTVFDKDDDEVVQDEVIDPVTQEDGYLSPAESVSQFDNSDVSSPARPEDNDRKSHKHRWTDDDFDDADVLSSPTADRTYAPHLSETSPRMLPIRLFSLHREQPTSREGKSEVVLVPDSPTRALTRTHTGMELKHQGPDLRKIFIDRQEDASSDIEMDEALDDDDVAPTPQCSLGSTGTTASMSGPETPVDVDVIDVDVEEIDLDVAAESGRARQTAVAKGWWAKWAGGGAKAGKSKPISPLKRRDTTVISASTPVGRHEVFRFRPQSAPTKSASSKVTKAKARARPQTARRSLVFTESMDMITLKPQSKSTGGMGKRGVLGVSRQKPVNASVNTREPTFSTTAMTTGAPV